MIKFRYGKGREQGTVAPAPAPAVATPGPAATAAAPAPSSGPRAKGVNATTLYVSSLPPSLGRPPFSKAELEAIESGGATRIW